tara:strand:+ start:2065 stop:2226 length:162 start_codon:yes stop_codon:yes gene_type:complete
MTNKELIKIETDEQSLEILFEALTKLYYECAKNLEFDKQVIVQYLISQVYNSK